MEFAHLGKSCSLCNTQDFLPFTCDSCYSVFCLEHRSYIAHKCTKSIGKDHKVVSCPLCSQSIHFFDDGSASVHEIFDKHLRLECVNRRTISGSSNTSSLSSTQSSTTSIPIQSTSIPIIKAPKRCSTKGCKEILTTSNTYYCPKCRQETCLKHRFGDAHDCINASRGIGRTLGNNSSSSLSNSNSTKLGISTTSSTIVNPTLTSSGTAASTTTNIQGSSSVVNTRSPQQTSTRNFDMRAQLRETAHRRGAVQSRGGGSSGVGAGAGGGGNGSGEQLEPCTHCGAVFADAVQLVEHVSTAHSPENEQCSQCGQVFQDVASLISHTETVHSTNGGDKTSGSNGSCTVC